MRLQEDEAQGRMRGNRRTKTDPPDAHPVGKPSRFSVPLSLCPSVPLCLCPFLTAFCLTLLHTRRIGRLITADAALEDREVHLVHIAVIVEVGYLAEIALVMRDQSTGGT